MVDVSTITSAVSPGLDTEFRLHDFVSPLEPGPDLLDPERMAERLAVLDRLDRIAGDWTGLSAYPDAEIAGVRALRIRLEAVNQVLYEEARAEILREGSSRRFRQWLAGDEAGVSPRPGLSFDLRDEIVSGVLPLREPDEPEVPRSAEMLAYQPTPARHVVDLIARCELSCEDLLVDLGSGLGHVPLLVSMLTGNPTLGVELEPAYVGCARECADSLRIRQARFVAEDARAADLSSGTVFYLYTPFTGAILRDVLDRLRQEARNRPIRIGSLGPCTGTLLRQEWLQASAPADTGRIAMFESQ